MAQGRCSAVLAVALLVVSCAAAVQATNYTVGDAQGWSRPNGNTIPDGYLATWASGKTFNAGDNLMFNYNPIAHSVLQVSQSDYTGCVTTSPMEKYTSGNDTVKLAGGTTYYFICGTPGHCSAGQKLSVATTGTPAPAKSAAASVASSLQALVAASVASVAAIAFW